MNTHSPISNVAEAQTARKHPLRLHWKILIGFLALIAVVLLAIRLYLGTWVLGYVNNVLLHIPGYQGSVESVDLNLYRGAYTINKLVLNKAIGKIPTPFISIETAEFSLQWSALLHGRVVSSVVLTKPTLNFASTGAAKQTGADVDWTQPIKNLAPVDINYVEINDGTITYQDFSSTPKVDLFIHKLHGRIDDLRNVEAKGDRLPSAVSFEGTSIGNGTLKLDGRVNILKEQPDMDVKTSLEGVDLPAINNYTEAYAAFDFEKGKFNLYSQVGVRDGQVTGYVKPIVTALSVKVFQNANPVETLWSTVVAGILKVFTNLPKDQFATEVHLSGSLTSINTDAWSAFIGILHNAFISAMTKGFDQTSNGDAVSKPK